MTDAARDMSDLERLVEAVCEDTITDAEAARLEELLKSDPRARREYLRAINLHGALLWDAGKGSGEAQAASHEQRGTSDDGRGLGTSVPSLTHLDIDPASPISTAPPIVIQVSCPSSISPFLSFVGSALSSYLAAAFIMGVGLLIAWAWKLPDAAQLARHNPPSPVGRGVGGEGSESQLAAHSSVVARITGMVDCRWEQGARDGGAGDGDEQEPIPNP